MFNTVQQSNKQNTIKIGEIEPICNDKEHNPPMFQYFENGIYKHTCPNCGNTKIFTVNHPSF